MKKHLLLATTLVTTIAVIGLAGCSGGSPTAASPSGGGVPGSVVLAAGSDNSSQTTGIWVTGTGTVTVTPDIALLSIGVSDQETTVAAAQAIANDAMNKVMAVLKAQGIADKDIQTSFFSIQPVTRYDNTKNESIIVGYMVSNMVTAKVRTIDKIGTVIDAAAAAGGDATRINGVTFSVDKPESYFGQARGLAMADAKATADQLASLAGVKLGGAFYITESSGNIPTPVPIMRAAAGGGATQVTTPISAGETEITLTVTVAYTISQ